MKRKIFRIVVMVILISLLATPVFADAPAVHEKQTLPPGSSKPERPAPELLPQEILDKFENGMTIEEFLIQNKGPIPNALQQYADMPVTVIVQMDAPSLIEKMEQDNIIGTPAQEEFPQHDYSSDLISQQDAVFNQLSAGLAADSSKAAPIVISQYTKVLNGMLMSVPASEINTIRALPGVTSVSRAPRHEIDLTNSVHLINADAVWAMTPVGFTGAGITVAVIDTGVDYTHAMFDGPGTPVAYSSNDPDIIEPGTFPTAKVIGGYDFAGTDYDARYPATSIPVPDDDPLDEAGHGTHVASTIAGINVGFGSGVAPQAYIYALKVFGAEGSTDLVIDAIEWAMDPNGDGNISDHVDVINMSLGSSFGPNDETDPEIMAVEAANMAGVFVVASAGNAGNTNYVVGAPSVSDSALSVAASSTGFQTAPFIEFSNEGTQHIPYTVGNPLISAITTDLVAVDAVDGSANGVLGIGYLCDADVPLVTPDALTGKIALISRGSCSFEIKINNAQALGALAAIIYNNTTGTLSMATGTSTLPAGSILQSDGLALKALAPLPVSVGPDTNVETFVSPTPADTIASFSSRGPRGYDSKLKPEISAPGVDIYAANMGSGSYGVGMSGTSMAAPHVAGVAVLMKQAHPNWTNEQIKAAIMNTAVDLNDPVSSEVPRAGAGRVDAEAAVKTKVVAVGDKNLVSLSWGLVEVGAEMTFEDTKTITVRNFGSTMISLAVGTHFTSAEAGATLTPSSATIDVPANGSVKVDLTLNLDGALLPADFGGMEEYYGYVFFDGDAELRVPFYFVPRPYTELTTVEEVTSFNIDSYGYVDLEQDGPIASSLWAYPLVLESDNDPGVADMADLRYVGLDYDNFNGLIVPAFNMWAPQHTTQPYWSEVDMYIDADQDGIADVVNFNYNYGAATGGDPDNDWIVFQVDLSDNSVSLASPYGIYTDFNSGFQEWYLPPGWNGIADKFSYDVVSTDWYGNEDYAGGGQFDISKPPLMWDILPSLDPQNESFSFLFGVDNKEGYHFSNPLGVMLVDYMGKPGVGQVYAWEWNPLYMYYFPLISK